MTSSGLVIVRTMPCLQDYCRKIPKEVCNLRFAEDSAPSLQPVVQQYCVPIADLEDSDINNVDTEVTTAVMESETADSYNDIPDAVKEKQSRTIDGTVRRIPPLLPPNTLDRQGYPNSKRPEYETTKIDGFTIPKMTAATTSL